MAKAAVLEARRALFGAPAAHLYDYIGDRTTREAIRLRQFGVGGGDAAPMIQQASDEGASILTLPDGGTAMRSSVILSNMRLDGEAPNPGALHPPGARGSTVELWSRTAKPFRCGPNPSFHGLTFDWPEQRDKPPTAENPTPIVYPALISSLDANTNLSGLDMHNCNAPSAFDLFEAGGNGAFNKAGQWAITHCRLNALRWAFNLNHFPDFLLLTGSAFGWNLFGDELNHYGAGGAAAGGNFYLRPWTVDNSALFRIWGDGAASQMATRSVDGLLTSNLMGWGFRTLLLIDGGRVTNTTLDGVFDGCQQLVRVINHGAAADLSVRMRPGSYAYKYAAPGVATPPLIEAVNPRFLSISIEGEPVTNGELVRISGADVSDIDIRLNARGFAKTDTPGTYYAVDIDAPNADVNVDLRAKASAPSGGGVTRHGVRIVAARSSRTRAHLINCQTPIEIGASQGQHLVDGCVTVGTGGAKSLIAGPAVKRGANAFDKPELNFVGEDFTTTVPLASDQAATVGYLDLPPGTWDVSVAPRFSGEASALVSYALACASLSASGLDLGQGRAACHGPTHRPVFAGCGFITPNVNPTRFELTGAPTTRVYFRAQAGFDSGAMAVHGRIEARRAP